MTRGRPAENPTVLQERTVARLFERKSRLYEALMVTLSEHHPSIDERQRLQLSQTLFAVSEEFRLWSEVENILLGVQRSQSPDKHFQLQKPQCQALLAQLSSFYALYLSTQAPTQCSDNVIHNENIDFTSLQNADIPRQTLGLKQLADSLALTIEDAVNVNKDGLQSLRTQLRQTMQFVLHHRLTLAYPPQKHERTGRPSIPLPVQYVRAEQALIHAYLVLCQHWKAAQQKILSPIDVWEQNRKRVEKHSVGRPTLTERQRIERDLKKTRRELTELERDVKPVKAPSQRGRKPMPLSEKKARLQHAIATLEQKLSSASTSLSKI